MFYLIRRVRLMCRYCMSPLVCVLLFACSKVPENVIDTASLPSIYPDYIGVTIPVGIAPLNFSMIDDEVTAVYVEIKGKKRGEMYVSGDNVDIDIDEWHKLLEMNRGSGLEILVYAMKDGQWARYKPFDIHISQYPLDEWGMTYRRIAPGYKMYGHMGIYQRELATFEETALIDNRNLEGGCVNCHTSNRGRSDNYVFHVRSMPGGTVIGREGKTTFLPSVNDSIGGAMVYPYWHPGGRFVAFSTNKTSQLFHSGLNKRIEVFDGKSDVFIYDVEKRLVLKDTLLMKKLWAENCPAFSPDGKWLYFTTARRMSYPKDYDKEKYSLCRVAFDEKTGKLGAMVDTLVSSYSTGKSVTWPRPSYDGRYIMYTLADYGYFSVWHPESDLWLYDLQTGHTRLMDEVNSDCAESLHNWSRNSRWFFFTSRRENGLYTQIYLSSLDENGKATKPFLLPQRNPKRYYRRLMYSFNTPDFVLQRVVWDYKDIVRGLGQN